MAKVELTWEGDMLFESNGPGGTVMVDSISDDKENKGLSPKALMLTALAGCGGLDVVSLLKKMRAEVDDIKIDVTADLTDEHPRIYKNVVLTYYFFGSDFKKDKIQKAVDLSKEKYCGVLEMFRGFTDVDIKIEYIEQ